MSGGDGNANKGATGNLTIDDLACMIRELGETLKIIANQKTEDQAQNDNKFKRIDHRLEDLERDSNKKAIIISGIQAEEHEDLAGVIVKIAEVLNVPINDTEIDDIWRIGRDKALIKIVFLRSITKRSFIRKVRERKKLSSQELGLSYEAKIYLNEALGQSTMLAWNKARELVKKKLVNKAWVSEGKIYYKTREQKAGDVPKLCKTIEELLAIENGDAGAQSQLDEARETRTLRRGTQKSKK